MINNTQAEPRDSSSGASAVCSNPRLTVPLCAVLLLCAAIFSPVLLKPHWGLYSDPHQIVEMCRNFYSSSHVRWDLIQGFYRPGFHSIDIATWSLSKNNPLGFYIVRLVAFLLTVSFTFLNCFKFTRRRSISGLAALAWVFISPAFEVIYTLDKAETYIACLFSVVIWAYLSTDLYLAGDGAGVAKVKPARIILPSLLIALCATWAVFTKETGQLVLPLGLALPIGVLIANKLTTLQPNGENSERHLIAKRRLYWSLGTCAICLSSLAVYKAYFYLNGGANAHYGSLTLSVSFLMQQLSKYVRIVPEFFILCGFCLLNSAVLLIARRTFVLQEAHRYMLAGIFTVVPLAGSVALMSWTSVLVYIWYPLFAMLLPAVSFHLMSIGFKSPGARAAVLSVFTLALLCWLPQRIVDAQLQFQLDDSVQGLVDSIADFKGKGTGTVMGIPFTRPEYAEVGEEIESLALNKLLPDHVEQKADDKHLPPISFYNYLSYELPDKVFEKLKQPIATKYALTKMDGIDYSNDLHYVAGPGVNRFSYWSDNGRGKHWIVDNLREGNIILVPFGDLSPTMAFRGAGLFCSDWKTKLLFLPQLKFSPVFTVTRKITRPGSHRFTIGWIALKVVSSPKISWLIDSGGYLRDGTPICTARDLTGHTLYVDAELSQPMVISENIPGQNIELPVQPIRRATDGPFEIRLPIGRNSENSQDNGFPSFLLHLKPLGGPDPAPLLHVKKAYVF